MTEGKMTAKPTNIGLWLLVVALFAVAGLLLARDYKAVKLADAASPVGKPARDAPLTTLSGGSTSLHSFAGHPVWLNFFATWCPPCKAEMPQIETRYRRLHGQGLEVVGVDQEETPELIARFTRPFSITFPIVIDEGPAAAAYGVFALPTSVFIDARGIVRVVRTGELSPDDMDEYLARIM
ncbi:MAG TPA: redoxin domain-containing protein [Candidatus Acidoferrales bacterium]|nr:redoxin domain-containing protein [Candidatus Acidoferrales bacterium]